MNRKPKCKQCGERFVPFYNNSLQKYCMNYPKCREAQSNYAKKQKDKQDNKDWKKRKKDMDIKVNPKKYKGQLQDEINKLARKIDFYFNMPCICTKKPYQGQVDAAHYHNVGGHENIRFNLHNIHSSRAHSNQYDPNHKTDYKAGLISRYGNEYYEYVEYELNLKYKELHITSQEVYEKLAIVRKINREFDTYVLFDPKSARDMFNKMIGIYK